MNLIRLHKHSRTEHFVDSHCVNVFGIFSLEQLPDCTTANKRQTNSVLDLDIYELNRLRVIAKLKMIYRKQINLLKQLYIIDMAKHSEIICYANLCTGFYIIAR